MKFRTIVFCIATICSVGACANTTKEKEDCSETISFSADVQCQCASYASRGTKRVKNPIVADLLRSQYYGDCYRDAVNQIEQNMR